MYRFFFFFTLFALSLTGSANAQDLDEYEGGTVVEHYYRNDLPQPIVRQLIQVDPHTLDNPRPTESDSLELVQFVQLNRGSEFSCSGYADRETKVRDRETGRYFPPALQEALNMNYAEWRMNFCISVVEAMGEVVRSNQYDLVDHASQRGIRITATPVSDLKPEYVEVMEEKSTPICEVSAKSPDGTWILKSYYHPEDCQNEFAPALQPLTVNNLLVTKNHRVGLLAGGFLLGENRFGVAGLEVPVGRFSFTGGYLVGTQWIPIAPSLDLRLSGGSEEIRWEQTFSPGGRRQTLRHGGFFLAKFNF